MNIDDINNKIQNEKDSYNRDLNRLNKEILKLKDRHQRTMADLQNQKLQAKQQQTNNEAYSECSMHELNNRIKDTLNKF